MKQIIQIEYKKRAKITNKQEIKIENFAAMAACRLRKHCAYTEIKF